MNSASKPVIKQPAPAEYPTPPPQNGIGLAGFVVSLVGLFFCGIPAVFGVLISLIGLTKTPKGFATAGLVIGLVGMLELAIVCAMIFSAYQVGKSASVYLQEFPVSMQLNMEAQTVGNEWEKLERLPNQAEGDLLLRGKRDLMGNQLVYETDGTSFTLRSAGADGTLNTDDDIVAGPFEDIESTRQFDPSQLDWEQEGFDPESFQELLEQELPMLEQELPSIDQEPPSIDQEPPLLEQEPPLLDQKPPQA